MRSRVSIICHIKRMVKKCVHLCERQGGIKARAIERVIVSPIEQHSVLWSGCWLFWWVTRRERARKHHPQSTLFLLDSQKENILAIPHKQENRNSTDNGSVSGAAYIPGSTDNNKKRPFIHKLLLEYSCVLHWIVCCYEYHMYSKTQNNHEMSSINEAHVGTMEVSFHLRKKEVEIKSHWWI